MVPQAQVSGNVKASGHCKNNGIAKQTKKLSIFGVFMCYFLTKWVSLIDFKDRLLNWCPMSSRRNLNLNVWSDHTNVIIALPLLLEPSILFNLSHTKQSKQYV
jgi:hypothetical protein